MTRALRVSLAIALLLAATAAHAQLSAALVASPAPLVSAMTAYGTPSSLTVTVTNTSGRVLHRIEFTLPNTGYTASGGSGPSGWTATNASAQLIRFTNLCSGTGLASGASASFTISFTPPQTPTASDIAQSSNFTATGYTRPASGVVRTCPAAYTTNGPTFTAPVKVLLVSGTVSQTQFFTGPATVTTTWSVYNRSSQTKYAITLQPVVTPAATSTTCSTITSLSSQNTTPGTITCTHVLPAGGTYTFAANVSGRPSASGAVDATAVGAYATSGGGSGGATVQVGNPAATWTQGVMVRGRRLPYTVVFNVVNGSPLAITRVTLGGVSGGGFTLLGASATNGLGYAGASGNSLLFTGTLAAGATSAVTIQLNGTAPTTTTTYPTQVVMTASTGATATSSGQVAFVVPVPDVSGLTVLSTGSGQTLAWTNTSGAGSSHDGVVVFRTPAGTAPQAPVDFVDYQASPVSTLFYADKNGSTTASLTDGLTGAYDYRVCNHDAYFVYSDCSSGFWNGAGYVDSATAPSGGWTHQLGGEDLASIGALPLGRAAIPTNRPDVNVVQLSTGQRIVDPIALPAGSLPPANSPGTLLANGKWVSFIADQGGNITAIDLQAGAIYWRVTKSGESFTAGVAGVTRSGAAPAFQAAFPNDVLFLGSASTGRVYAIDATTGATLWTVTGGANVYALPIYDPTTNFVYVPTSGSGILALDLGPASPTVAAKAAATWKNPGGTFRQFCVRTPVATAMACVDTSGVLTVLDRTTGAVRASLATAVASPTMLSKVSNGTPGFVVGSTSQVLRVTANATLTSLAPGGRWQPSGQRLSPLLVNSALGWIMVASNDLRLHKLSSETGLEIGQSPAISSRTTGMLLGTPSYDATNNRFLFGTSEGRVWSIPVF